jgi:D-alanyl-D-alanine carboxypeptidase
MKTKHLFIFACLSAFMPLVAQAQSSVMVVDLSNRKVHVAANANIKRPVGGLAKIAATMVALDWAQASGTNLSTLATVPDYAEKIAGETTLDIHAGDQITLRDLLYATTMGSDNVAAITLGHFVGGDLLQRKGKAGDPLEEFVKNMNALAQREGCKNTKFMNPHGYENSRPQPYSSAADMARIAVYAASRPAYYFYANQTSRSITVNSGGGKKNLTIRSTNSLLGTSRIDGLKTASTPLSGGCAAITADKPATVSKQPDGASMIYRHRMIVVVIGSPDPLGEARSLLQQGWSAYDAWLASNRQITAREQLLQYY